MKIKILLLLIPLFAISQSKPFYKQTITAYEINLKDTINKKVLVTYLDKSRSIITTENNITNAISGSRSNRSKTHAVVEVDSDRLYIVKDIDEKGNTIDKTVYVYDDKKNVTENYQIKNGDTITGQKRVYNKLGKCTKIYNKQRVGHKYVLFIESEYDSKGNITESKTYDEYGNITGHEKYENVYRKGELIITKSSYREYHGFVNDYKVIKKKRIATTYYYSGSIGYNYGIKIKIDNGGMSIYEEDKKEILKNIKYLMSIIIYQFMSSNLKSNFKEERGI